MDKSIIILTGEGVSAESGLQTFRASDGLWCEHQVEDVATPEAFVRDPALVHSFYNMRRKPLSEVRPNAAHLALAKLASEWEGGCLLITQNVDDLHDRAVLHAPPKPGFNLIHMHGELKKGRHVVSGEIREWEGDIQPDGDWRPHIVWFGEMPLQMDLIYQALCQCDLFMSIGTSGNVYPAAGFVTEALCHGAQTVEINLEPSAGASLFEEVIYGSATQTVPAYVERILGGEVL